MSKDAHNKRAPHRGSRAENSAGADDTVQISNAELAAIRQSASNPEITPEILSEMDRRRWREESRQRAETPHQPDAIDRKAADDDATKSFDRRRIDAMLQSGLPPESGIGAPDAAEDAADQDEIDTGVADGALADAVIAQARLDAGIAPAADNPETVEVALDDAADPAGLFEISEASANEFAAITEDDIYDAVFGAQPDEVVDAAEDLALDDMADISAAPGAKEDEVEDISTEPEDSSLCPQPEPVHEPTDDESAADLSAEEITPPVSVEEPGGPVEEPAALVEQIELPQAREQELAPEDDASQVDALDFEHSGTRPLAKVLALIGLIAFIGGTLRFVAPAPFALISESLAVGLVAAGAAMVLAAIVLPRR